MLFVPKVGKCSWNGSGRDNVTMPSQKAWAKPSCPLLHLVQGRRNSGISVRSSPSCPFFGGGCGCDLIPHKNHICSPNSLKYLWNLGWMTAAFASHWKEQHSPWGSARLLHFGDVCKISPPQSIYCTLVLEDSSSCTTQRSPVFSWSHFPSVFHPTWGWGCIFRFVGGRFHLDQNHLSTEASLSPNKSLTITCWFLQSNLKNHSLACTPQQIFLKNWWHLYTWDCQMAHTVQRKLFRGWREWA